MESKNGKWSKLTELLDAQHELLSKYMSPSNELEILEDLRYELNEEIERKKEEEPVDSITREVISMLSARSHKGFREYNASMDRQDLSLVDWCCHAREEALDMCIYLTKIINTQSELDAKRDREMMVEKQTAPA